MKTVIGATMLTVLALAVTPVAAADKTRTTGTTKSADTAAQDKADPRNGPAASYAPERTLVDQDPGKWRDVSPGLADWLERNHARPAGG